MSNKGDIVPESSAAFDRFRQSTFYSAVWATQTDIGDGFDRLTCTYKGSAVTASYEDVNAAALSRSTVSMTKFGKVVDSAETFSESIAGSASASYEGWGANVSATASASRETSFNLQSLNAIVRFDYLSQPQKLINPTVAGSNAALTEPARRLLEEDGPIAFHKAYGTHFVAGYIFGGSLLSYFKAVYSTMEFASAASAEVSAAFSSAFSSGSASASFSREVQKTKGFSNLETGYTAIGWSKEVPIANDLTLEAIKAAEAEFDLTQGQKLEAVLGEYRDLPSYHAALQVYKDAGGSDVYVPVTEDDFERVSQLLNHELQCMEFVKKSLQDRGSWLPFSTWRAEAEDVLTTAGHSIAETIALFGRDEDAWESWQAMIAYIEHARRHRGELPTPDGEPLAWQGMRVAEVLFRADELKARMEQLLNFEVEYSLDVWVLWVRAGDDGNGKYSEVEGQLYVHYEDGHIEHFKLRRSSNRQNRTISPGKVMLDRAQTRRTRLQFPVKVELNVREDDSQDKFRGGDDPLGTSTLDVDVGQLPDGSPARFYYGPGPKEKVKRHSRSGFNFDFGYSIQPHIKML